MSLQNIYLTIDDSPSIHMDKKVSFLKKHNIPAIFYARGEFIKKHPKQIINAINNGFLIGNHSYSHPYFSQIPLEKCFEEILLTETLIEDCYSQANIERPIKIIRLPFGDRGAGYKQPLEITPKVQEIQNFLSKHHFKPISFSHRKDNFIDSYWDWDTKDYKSTLISDQKSYLQGLESFYDNYTEDTAILLLHDFDNNHHLFEVSMQFLSDKNVTFLDFNT